MTRQGERVISHVGRTMPHAVSGADPGARASTGMPAAARSVVASSWLPVVLVGALALVVGAAGIGVPSLWTDEAVTISAARMSWPDLWAFVHTVDAVHAVYYATMKPWVAAFGASELAVRLPSAFAVAVACSGLVMVGRRLARPGVAVTAGVVLALLPRVTWAAVEARSYALTIALAVWATWAAVRLAERPATARVGRAVAYGALLAAGTWVNAYVLLLLPAHVLAVGVLHGWRRPPVRWVAAAGVVAAATVTPLVLLMSTQKGQLGAPSGSLLTLLRHVAVNQYHLGETPTPTAAALAGSGWSAWAVASVLLAVTTGGLILAALVRRPWRAGAHADQVRLWVWSGCWVVVPTVLLLAAAVVEPELYNPRYLAFTSGGYALAVAGALASLRGVTRAGSTIAVVALVAMVVPVYASQRTVYAKSASDWSEVAAYLGAHARPGDGVYYAPVYPPKGGLAGQTLRPVGDVYPDRLGSLVDVTLRTTPEQDHDLTGSSYLLPDSPRLPDVDVVWMVVRRDVDTASDRQTLLRDGFTEGPGSWTGPLTEVREFRRSGS